MRQMEEAMLDAGQLHKMLASAVTSHLKQEKNKRQTRVLLVAPGYSIATLCLSVAKSGLAIDVVRQIIFYCNPCTSGVGFFRLQPDFRIKIFFSESNKNGVEMHFEYKFSPSRLNLFCCPYCLNETNL